MNRALVVGLTGGLASGKSTALKELARLGAAVLSLDDVARRQARPGGPAYPAVVRAFGKGILGLRGFIDRRRLAERVFSRPERRRLLEKLTHPPILRHMGAWILRKSGRGGVVVVDAPLLFESGLQGRFDLTVVVSARRRTRLSRAVLRDGLSAQEAARRLNAQWPLKRKEGRADLVLENEGTRSQLRKKIGRCYRAWGLLSQYGPRPGSLRSYRGKNRNRKRRSA